MICDFCLQYFFMELNVSLKNSKNKFLQPLSMNKIVCKYWIDEDFPQFHSNDAPNVCAYSKYSKLHD